LTLDEIFGLALTLPEAVRASHFDNPDFRVRNKIFASSARPDVLVFKLTPEQQEMLTTTTGEVFFPIPNKWGKQGWTNAWIDKLDKPTALSALWMAWTNVAPKTLAKLHGRR
jgi:hypothetical protein